MNRHGLDVLRRAGVIPPMRRRFVVQATPGKSDERPNDERVSTVFDLSSSGDRTIAAVGTVVYVSAASHAGALVLVTPSNCSRAIPMQKGRGETLREFTSLRIQWTAQTLPTGIVGTPYLYLSWCYDTQENPARFA